MTSKLVDIAALYGDLVIDMRYATANNFTSAPIYKQSGCFLHQEAAQKLDIAVKLAAAAGFKVKIFDAFRPHEAQQALWNHTPDENYISHPETGSLPHCRGVAVDLTLLDAAGNELDMGTDFDDFSPLSHHGNLEILKQAQINRHILMGIMTLSGWDNYKNEWWHYQLFNAKDFPIIADLQAQMGAIDGL